MEEGGGGGVRMTIGNENENPPQESGGKNASLAQHLISRRGGLRCPPYGTHVWGAFGSRQHEKAPLQYLCKVGLC